MPYVLEHLQPLSSPIRWSPRIKTLYSFLVNYQFFTTLHVLTSLCSTSPLFKQPYLTTLFNTFTLTELFKLTKTSTAILQKKLTNTFVQTLYYRNLRNLTTKINLEQRATLMSELKTSPIYLQHYQTPYFFYTQPNYNALLQIFKLTLLTTWTQIPTQGVSTLSRWTLDSRFKLLRFLNSYFFKVANL